MKRTTTTVLLARLLTLAALAAAPSVVHADTQDGWEYLRTDNGVVVYRKNVEGSDIVAFKGVAYADLPIGKILATFQNPDERKFWVDRYAEHKTYEKAENSETYWIHFSLPPLVSDRDYVLRAEGKALPDKRTYTTTIKSVERADNPEDDCCVRAQVYGTYYEFVALPGEKKTKLTVEVHTDPKGSLPTWLVNLIQKSWPAKTLNGLINQAKVSPRSALPEYATWHDKVAALEKTDVPAQPPAGAEPAQAQPAEGTGAGAEPAKPAEAAPQR